MFRNPADELPRLAESNLVPSAGSVGDSYDNALAETINGLYKAGVIWRQRSWLGISAVEMAPLRWGRLVQPPSPVRPHRTHPAGRSRCQRLCSQRDPRYGIATQLKLPLVNPGRFRCCTNCVRKTFQASTATKMK
ncbi:integrase [Sphingobium sp. TKS]|nr:integrase [Sphingobium sp. TKS]